MGVWSAERGDPQDAIDGQPPYSILESQARDILIACAQSPQYFSKFCRTPAGKLPTYPFFLNRIGLYSSGRDVVQAKSRQMMASWAACLSRLHSVMFRRNYSGLITSRKESLVDDGGENSTFDSLLGRVRYLYDSLPPFLRKAAPVRFSHLRVSCEHTGSHLKGESTNPNIGRGGTYNDVLCDEWAFVPQSDQAYMAIRSACHSGLLLLSTPNGPDNNFARIWRERPTGFVLDRLHWTEHPLRYDGAIRESDGRPTSPWYESMCSSMTDDQIARELDIDFSRSASGLVYPEFSYDRHMSNALPYEPDLPLHMGMDFGIGAATAAVLFQVHGPMVRVLADYEQENAPAEVNAANVWSIARRIGFDGDRSELLCHGDPAGNAREIATGSTVIREYRQFGFVNFSTPRVKLRDGIRLVRRKLHRNEVRFSIDCNMVPLRMADYRYPTDESGAVKGDDPTKNRATHLMDALRYGVTALFPADMGDWVVGIETAPMEPLEPIPMRRGYEDRVERDAFRPVMSGKRDF